MLYRIGEHILLRANEDEQQVICVTDFFTLCSCGQYYAFVKGELYASPEQDENHIYSGNPIVIPTSEVIITLASNIFRKIMLYPDPDNIASPSCYVVIDFLRPHLPLCANDIIVPRGVQENGVIGLVVLKSAEILGLIICFAIHFICVTIV